MSDQLPITVLGAGGWIGSALVAALRKLEQPVIPVTRSDLQSWLTASDLLGPVIYAIGMTADFRDRPFDTVESHVCLLSRVLQRKGLSRFLFLSSTRVYGRNPTTDEESPLTCLSSDPSDLYNISKLMGEALVLQSAQPGFKVVRVSNVIGPSQPASTFIGSLLLDAQASGAVTIRQSPDSVKDYVALHDVVRVLPQVARGGRCRLYNLGSGINTSHADVAAWLRRQGIHVSFASQQTNGLSFPELLIQRISDEFDPPGDPFVQNPLELA